jgi:hypothetical protein
MSEQILLQDEFNDPLLAGWTQVIPTWAAHDGVLEGSDIQTSAVIVAGDLAWTDYEVTADTTILQQLAPVDYGISIGSA